MWTKTRHKMVFWFLRGPFKLFFRMKYNMKPQKYQLENKPYLILSNHLTTLDPFIVACSFKRPIYYMASTDLFSSKYGKIIEHLVAPIPKSKSVKDLGAIKDCIRVSREGGTVCIFPEGNRSYDGTMCYMDQAIAKLCKMLKLDIVLYNIHGGYGTDPRWCKKGRKGKSYGCVKKVLKYEDIAKMDNDELYQLIKDELTVEQVETKEIYKNKKNAEGLERALYYCPVCGKVQTLHTEGNYIKCSSCNLEVKYNNDLTLSSNNPNFKYKYIKEWYSDQTEFVKQYDINSQDIIYQEDGVRLFKMRYRKRGELLLEGKIIMTKDSIIVKNDEKEITYKLEDIFSFTVLGKHKMNFYIDKDTFQVKGKDDFNALKYMQMYYHITHIVKGETDEFFGM